MLYKLRCFTCFIYIEDFHVIIMLHEEVMWRSTETPQQQSAELPRCKLLLKYITYFDFNFLNPSNEHPIYGHYYFHGCSAANWSGLFP